MENLEINYPEMWGDSPAEIQAEYVLGKYRITSKKPIAIKRGIEYTGTVNNELSKRFGWHKYYLTELAFDKLCEVQPIVLNCLLD